MTYVDKFGGCVNFVRKTAKQLDIEDFIKINRFDVFKFMERTTEQYDYIFAGPPYALPTIDAIPDLIFEKKLLKENGWFVMEHNPHHEYDEHPRFSQKRNYGKTIFSFFIND